MLKELVIAYVKASHVTPKGDNSISFSRSLYVKFPAKWDRENQEYTSASVCLYNPKRWGWKKFVTDKEVWNNKRKAIIALAYIYFSS